MLGKAFSFLNTPEEVCEWPYPGHRADFCEEKKEVVSEISLMPYAALCVVNMFIFET